MRRKRRLGTPLSALQFPRSSSLNAPHRAFTTATDERQRGRGVWEANFSAAGILTISERPIRINKDKVGEEESGPLSSKRNLFFAPPPTSP